MRKLRLLALLAPALLLPAACEDDPNAGGVPTFNPPPPAGFEGGTTPPVEAGLPEAGVDAADAADAFVAPKGVTVTVLRQVMPVAGVRVISHDATGAVIGDVKTNATGKATMATAPAMVTVMMEYEGKGTYPAPVTFLGVADGDALLLNVRDRLIADSTNVGQYNVSFNTPLPFVGANDFFVRVGSECSTFAQSVAAPVTVDINTDCVPGAQAAVFVEARDTSFNHIGFAFMKNVAKPPVVATPANVGPLTFTAKGTTTLTATNIPNNASTNGDLVSIANSAGFYTMNTGGTLSGSDLAFATATGFADAYQVIGTSSVYTSNVGTNRSTLVRREATAAPASATLNIDFATSLPSITGVTITGADAKRPTVTLTSAASLAGADGAIVSVGFNNIGWRFIMPPSTTTFQVPSVPADSGDFVPSGTSNVQEINFVDSSLVPGYTQLKTLPVTPNGLAALDTNTPLPAAGTVRILHWDPSD